MAAAGSWVLVAHDNGVVIGIMPLHILRYRATPLRQVRFLGAPLSDFQEILAARGHEARCATRSSLIWRHIRVVGICAILPTSARARRSRWVRCRRGCVRCWCTIASARSSRCRASWDEFVKRLSKNMRTNVGRRRRQVAKQFRAEYDLADATTLPAAMEELFRLHNARWRRRGVAGAFAGARVQAFHHEVARRVPRARLAPAASSASRR